MNNITLFQELEKLLRMESQYCTEDGVLLKNAIVEAALAVRPDLIKLLLSHDALKRNFFTDIEGVLVFDKVKFQKFVMNKRFLPDSYTSYKNKIGLTNEDGEFLSESREVVLSWPYKDCMLEGGQTKDDAKRNEVFWNEILAPDEINRLTEPKVLTNFKKYDSDGEHEVDSISMNDNLIIKGNNLLALYSLKKKYAGKVKLIYIDPPYNTGNDSFGYNDSFNHSTWCTFMKNRLEIAYQLLRNDGTLCISIDHNEIAYCIAIVDGIFGKNNLKNIVTVKRGSVTGAKVINPGVVNLSDYVLIYSKSSDWHPNRVLRAKPRDVRYNLYIKNIGDKYENWKVIPLLDAFAQSLSLEKKNLKKELGGDLEYLLDQFVINNANRVIQFATLDDNNISQSAREIKAVSLNNPHKVFCLQRVGKSPYYILGGKLILFAIDRLIEIDGNLTFSEPISDIWDDVLPNDLHNEGGVIFKKGKKQEKLMQRILELTTEKGDIVLDYHLGSGTTAAVAHKMSRVYIGIEQLDYGKNDCVVRLRNVIGFTNDKQSYDKRGISESYGWQGGGSFVYCELAKANQNFVDEIKEAHTMEELFGIWQRMQETGFLSWKVEPKIINDNAKEFSDLSLEDAKRFLIECLDKNLLYVPYSEIDNSEFEISEDEKNINKQFYS